MLIRWSPPPLRMRWIIVRRSSLDVSLGPFGALEVGFTLWIAHGFALHNLAIRFRSGGQMSSS